MEHWSTLSKGIKFDLNRNSYPGSSLNQKGVEVLDTTDEEGTGRLATGGCLYGFRQAARATVDGV